MEKEEKEIERGEGNLSSAKSARPTFAVFNFSPETERTLLFSVHAGAMKVLGIVGSSYHFLEYAKIPSTTHKEKKKHVHWQGASTDHKQKISVIIPFIGIPMIKLRQQYQ